MMDEPKVQDLGWANGWQETPDIVKKCRELGHDRQDKSDAPGIPYSCFSTPSAAIFAGIFINMIRVEGERTYETRNL